MSFRKQAAIAALDAALFVATIVVLAGIGATLAALLV
jgi:hypothetical protein